MSSHIIVSGDSAGGGLALATVLSLRDDKEPLPALVVCLSPWADLTLTSQSHFINAEAESILTIRTLKEWSLAYTAENNLCNPLVSPVYAGFHNFPPLIIQVGRDEILLDDARTLADKAGADGVDVTLRIWEESPTADSVASVVPQITSPSHAWRWPQGGWFLAPAPARTVAPVTEIGGKDESWRGERGREAETLVALTPPGGEG